MLIGLFAVNQILSDIVRIEEKGEPVSMGHKSLWLGPRQWVKHGVNLLRSSVIGTWIGMLPGIGANIGSVTAYTVAKGFSRHPERFGTGSEEGIVASEAANNATIGGSLIPLIAMGLPGSVV